MNSAGWNSTFGLGNSAFCGGNNIHDNEDDDMSNVLIKKKIRAMKEEEELIF